MMVMLIVMVFDDDDGCLHSAPVQDNGFVPDQDFDFDNMMVLMMILMMMMVSIMMMLIIMMICSPQVYSQRPSSTGFSPPTPS